MYSRRETLSAWLFVEYLTADRTLLQTLERLIPIFQKEFTIFLSARDPSSAALAQQVLNAVGDVLTQMPVYQHLEEYSARFRSGISSFTASQNASNIIHDL